MKTVTLILKNILSEQEPILSEATTLQLLTKTGTLSRISFEHPLYENQLLGFAPNEYVLPQGPLSLAAFRKHPPDRSVQFHLSLASTTASGIVQQPNTLPTQAEDIQLQTVFERLSSKRLQLVFGENLDHGLVWEQGSLDHFTADFDSVLGTNYQLHLPQGDGEELLRKLIDDSINLLSDQEWNRIRVDEGQNPLNFLWPWGGGFQVAVPQLALRFGQPLQVESSSLRLEGLARLAGLQHGNRRLWTHPLKLPYPEMFDTLKSCPNVVFVLDQFEQLQRFQRRDERHWLIRALDQNFFLPLFEKFLITKEVNLNLFLLPENDLFPGLHLQVALVRSSTQNYPLVEELVIEKNLPVAPMSKLLRETYTRNPLLP